MSTDAGGVPDYLLEGPQGDKPAPPVDTAAQRLPFGELLWENFERLCVRLARLEAEVEDARPYGTRGQAQSGIDLYARLYDGSYSAVPVQEIRRGWSQ